MSSRQPQATPQGGELRDQLDAFWERLVGIDGDRQRAYPRVKVDTTIFFCVNGKDVATKLYDIGRGGLQVRCDRKTGARIAPKTGREPVPISVRGVLPDGSKKRPLKARCALVHVTMLNTDNGQSADVALGFRFEQLEPEVCQSLERFILSALEPSNA